MLDLMTLHTTQLQSQDRFSTRVRLGNEELSFVEQFHHLGHIITTADCRDDKDIKKQFRRQNAVGNMLVKMFSFAPIDAKIQLFKLYCYPIYGCALWRHSIQNSIRKLTVSYSGVNVVLRKFAYSLMSRVVASPNNIVAAIVNSDAYHQSPLMDKWESM